MKAFLIFIALLVSVNVWAQEEIPEIDVNSDVDIDAKLIEGEEEVVEGEDEITVDEEDEEYVYTFFDRLFYGGKVGVCLSSFHENSFSSGAKAGFTGGIYLSYEIMDFMSFQPEFLFTQLGGYRAYTEPFSGASNGESTLSGQVTINTFEMPLMFKFTYPMENSPVLPKLFIGASMRYELGATESYNRYVQAVNADYVSSGVKDVSSQFKNLNWALAVGAGSDFVIADSYLLSLDVRYTHGLGAVNENTYASSIRASNVYMNALIVTVGFAL